MATLKKQKDIFNFIIEQWNVSGLEFDKDLKTYFDEYGFSKTIQDHINNAMHYYTPSATPPDWLAEIDNLYRKENMTNQATAGGFAGKLRLLAPLVYFDHLVDMQSFSDAFMHSLEIAWLSRLDMPRDEIEAERLYKKILELPHAFDYYKFSKPYTSPQPFMAQMLFAAFILKPEEKHSALWNYQYDCLINCPEYLLDHPDITKEGFSYRPAFWMAMVQDPDFREVLSARGSAELKRNLSKEMAYEAKRAAATADIASEHLSNTLPLARRVPATQSALADLLMELDALLQQEYPQIYKTLRPGVNDDQIDKLNALLHPLKLPEDLATLYKWHNGVEQQNGFLFGFPDLYPLEEALNEYRQTNDMCAKEQCGWCSAWFTISYEARTYRLAVLSESSRDNSSILYHDMEGGDIEVQFDSIAVMIKSYIRAYQDGLIEYDEEYGYGEIVDDERFEEICKEAAAEADATQGSGLELDAYDPFELEEWPAEWQKYQIAFYASEADRQADKLEGATLTIGDLNRLEPADYPEKLIVRGQVTDLAGSSTESSIQLTDEADDSVNILCPAPWSNRLRIEDWFEIELQGRLDAETVNRLEEEDRQMSEAFAQYSDEMKESRKGAGLLEKAKSFAFDQLVVKGMECMYENQNRAQMFLAKRVTLWKKED